LFRLENNWYDSFESLKEISENDFRQLNFPAFLVKKIQENIQKHDEYIPYLSKSKFVENVVETTFDNEKCDFFFRHRVSKVSKCRQLRFDTETSVSKVSKCRKMRFDNEPSVSKIRHRKCC